MSRKSEVTEMREMLRRHGYNPDSKPARKLLAEGIGPTELAERLKIPPGEVGSLQRTHGLFVTKVPPRNDLVQLLQNPSPAMQAVMDKMRGKK